MNLMRRSIRAMAVCALLVFSSASTGTTLAEDRIAVYFGPQLRDGFVDMDAGIRDSIRDLQEEIKALHFETVPSSSASIQLIVLGRGAVRTAAAVGVNYGGVFSTFPTQTPTLSVLLKVEKYERIFQSEGATWRNAAKNVAEDFKAWVDANRSVLK
jgi:hypothetical protein